MKPMMLRVHGIVSDSVVDGPGLRLAIFAQGCPHHCPGCHNPGTHDPAGGYELSVMEILSKMRENPLLSGITLTGGEPFAQPAACAALAEAIPWGDVWAYTGYTYEELLEIGDKDQLALLDACDVLVDGRFIQGERSLELAFRGSRNQRVIDMKKTRASGRVFLWERPTWVP